MNIDEEKEYIYSLMREITSERRKLTDIYYDLKKRLDELNSLEVRGLNELSVSGYIDLINKRDNNVVANNLRRELESVTKEPAPAKEESIIPKNKIDDLKEADRRKSRRNFKKKLNTDKVYSEMCIVLKEAGIPLKVDEIRIRLEKRLEQELSPTNFRNNLLQRILKKTDTRVERASFGYYQYRVKQ
jgi:hypothetical protein